MAHLGSIKSCPFSTVPNVWMGAIIGPVQSVSFCCGTEAGITSVLYTSWLHGVGLDADQLAYTYALSSR